MVVIHAKLENTERVKGALTEIRKRMREALLDALTISTKEVKKEAKALVPVRTGKTRNSIEGWVSRREMTGYVGSGWHIARFLEYGVSSHEIKTKNRKVLSDGKNVYGTVVSHPGMRPRPYLQLAVGRKTEFVQNTLYRTVEKAIREVLRGD